MGGSSSSGWATVSSSVPSPSSAASVALGLPLSFYAAFAAAMAFWVAS